MLRRVRRFYLFLLIGRTSGAGYQVDAVSVALLIGKIVSQMRAIDTHGLSTLEDANVCPVNVLIAEAGPSVCPRLGNEFIKGALVSTETEKRLSGIGISEHNLLIGLEFLPSRCHKSTLLRKEVSAVLGVVAVVVANAIGRILIAPPPQIVLDRNGRRAVRLLAHNLFVSHDDRGTVL